MADNMVLILDDEEMIVKSIKRLLYVNGINAIGTSDPEEALRILKNEDVALFISDQRMPVTTGLEVLMKAKAISPTTLRILITGYSDIDVLTSAINEGQIFHYITKPWDDNKLLEIIKKALAYRQETLEKEYILKKLLKDSEDWSSVVSQLYLMVDQSLRNSVHTLEKIMEVKDVELYHHCQRVRDYALAIADDLGFEEEQKRNLEYACLFHDLGKIAVRDQIIYKEGNLDNTEFSYIKLHPGYSADIIKQMGFMDVVADIILQHHEKVDGTGYPQGLKDEQILLEAKVLAVADVYDALVSNRIYREGIFHADALNILQEDSGTHFDPSVVQCFVERYK